MIEWMAWTYVTAIFFIVIGALLMFMTILETIKPTVARKGWLQITTTRGERLFISLLVTAWINIFWIAYTDYSQWSALLIGLAVSTLILARG